MRVALHWMYIIVMITVFIFTSCDTIVNNGQTKVDSKILASVQGANLYESDLLKLSTGFSSAGDSASFVNNYIEDWILSELLYNKAKSFIPNKVEIDRMVEHYRRELSVHAYERIVLNNASISEIGTNEIRSFYNEFKTQKPLDEDLYKLKVMVMEENAEKLNKFERGWRKDDEVIIDEYKTLTHFYQLDTSVWFTRSMVMEMLPKGFPNERLKNKGFVKSKVGVNRCFLHIYDKKNKGSIPPLDYVEPKIKKILRHQEQLEILKRYKEDLYNEALRNKKITIYNN